jgi:predicted dehydrogenase
MVRVGVVGTSWWSDAMYLPALQNHPEAEVVAVCGRDYQRLKEFAEHWNVPNTYTDWRAMLDSGRLEAVIIATPNDTHYPITMSALDYGLHILCEKPLSLTYAQAKEMADSADAKGVVNMVPFTYRYMPTTRYIKQLIDAGYIGTPYHLNMRYYAGYGRESKYDWRFDNSIAGAGVVGDLGSHWLHVARWIFGEITSLSCHLETFMQRPNRPDGSDYPRGDDSAVLTVKFESGAYGVLQVTTMAYEGTKFGQTHHMEFHGSAGTLYNFIDWQQTQQVRGLKAGDTGGAQILEVPEIVWQGARQDDPVETYHDIFRNQNHMTRQFIHAAAEGNQVQPNFREGARVQQLIEAAVESAKTRCWVDVPIG